MLKIGRVDKLETKKCNNIVANQRNPNTKEKKIRIEEKKMNKTIMEREIQIPIIDMEKMKGGSSVLEEACKKWGCFRLLNHGVPTNLMAEMKSLAKELFDRPVEMKLRQKEVVAGNGYIAPSEKYPFYEAIGILDVSDSHFLTSFCSDLQVNPHQREIIEMYAQTIYKLAIDVSRKMATSMEVTDYSFDNWTSQFRINKYTLTQDNIGSPGLATHTDSAFLTILQDDENIGGLEVMEPSGTFVGVDPLPDSFFVVLGDMAVPWSNGQLRNVQHRVKLKLQGVGIRLSVATFLSPPLDEIIESHPQFVDDNHPRLYSPFTFAQIREIRAAENLYAGEALERVGCNSNYPDVHDP